MLMRKVHGQQLATLMLTSSEYFVLDLMVQNMESRQMEMVSYNFMMIMMATTNFWSHQVFTTSLPGIGRGREAVQEEGGSEAGQDVWLTAFGENDTLQLWKVKVDFIFQVIIDEPKAPSAPRHGSDSSGFGSGKGEPSKVMSIYLAKTDLILCHE